MNKIRKLLKTIFLGLAIGVSTLGLTSCSSTEKTATSYDFSVVSCTYNTEEDTTKVVWVSNLVNNSIFDIKEESFKFDLYENDTFVVKPLLTKEDFHKEGEAQRNCVERLYMEKVYEGHTHVVTVRLKTNPDKSYITCEVTNNGLIYQYLAFGNETPNDEAAKNFKKEYQQHLKTAREKN